MTPRDRLDPTLWKDDDTLRPAVRDAAIEKWVSSFQMKFTEPTSWGTLYLIGSATSYQYMDEGEDADFNLVVNLDAFRLANPRYAIVGWEDIRREMHSIGMKHIDGTWITPDSQPMQIYVRDENDDAAFLATVRFMAQGCYDVLHDKWVVPPIKIDEQFDAMKAFAEWEPIAEGTVQKVKDAITEYRRNPGAETEKICSDLYHKLHDDRQRVS